MKKLPTAIRVYPLSRRKEPNVFSTRTKAFDYFTNGLRKRKPSGRFNIRTDRPKFVKDSLILFQYTEIKNQEEIIAHAVLSSDGCIESDDYEDYVGYYLLDIASINFYKNPVTKEEIYRIWGKDLWRARLNLDVSKYNEYMTLLKNKKNIS